MSVLEDLEREYVRDSMGRLKRVCPTCGLKRFPGKSFLNEWEDCYYCRRDRSGVKRCSSCGEAKPLSEFPEMKRKTWRCSPCHREYQARWREENRERMRIYQRAYASGLEAEVFVEELATATQCPICERAFADIRESPHVDHDHRTGAFRGILCGRCNRALGLFGDSVEGLRRALSYLEG